MNPNIRQMGFTLTEMMMTVVILGVLMGVAAPSMRAVAQNSRITATHNELTGALQLARSEAVKRRTNVSICARATDTSCGEDWRNGWLVFTDGGATPGTVDAGEEVLAVVQSVAPGIRVANLAKLAAGSGGIAARHFVRFSGRGSSNWQGGGTFVLCDPRGENSLSALNIVVSGDIRSARKSAGTVTSVFGTAAACPGTTAVSS
ncbi:MAG: GspH/FimT family pseudopilin [Granulosicoccus sp.]|nr:GspH/FimT family pseudopilin [Granulosicoccus sp.]